MSDDVKHLVNREDLDKMSHASSEVAKTEATHF